MTIRNLISFQFVIFMLLYGSTAHSMLRSLLRKSPTISTVSTRLCQAYRPMRLATVITPKQTRANTKSADLMPKLGEQGNRSSSKRVMRNSAVSGAAALIAAYLFDRNTVITEQNFFPTYGRNIILLVDEFDQEYFDEEDRISIVFNLIHSLSNCSSIIVTNDSLWQKAKSIYVDKEQAEFFIQYFWHTYQHSNGTMVFIPKVLNAQANSINTEIGIDLTTFSKVENPFKLPFEASTTGAIVKHYFGSSTVLHSFKSLMLDKAKDINSQNFPWTIMIGGHGLVHNGYSSVCGMHAYYFKQLLEHFKSLSTKAVFYGSCYAGSPLNLEKLYNFNGSNTFDFPIICFSLGSIQTSTGMAQDKKISDFFARLAQLKIDKKNPLEFSKLLEVFFLNNKNFGNIPHIRWAGEDHFEILQTNLSNLNLSNQPYRETKSDNAAFILNEKIIEQDVKLTGAGNFPNFYIESGLPGCEHHLIRKLAIPTIVTPKDLLSSFLGFSGKYSKSTESKTYLIDSFTFANNKVAKNVIIFNRTRFMEQEETLNLLKPYKDHMLFEVDGKSYIAYVEKAKNYTFKVDQETFPEILVAELSARNRSIHQKLYSDYKQKIIDQPIHVPQKAGLHDRRALGHPAQNSLFKTGILVLGQLALASLISSIRSE